MRISDWSSDVGSSDLALSAGTRPPRPDDAAPFPENLRRGLHKASQPLCDGAGERGFGTQHCRSREFLCRLGRTIRAPARESRSAGRSEEHTSELQSLMRISYAGFCLKKKKH